MKIHAISTTERAFIIRQLKLFSKWEAQRMGAHVRIVRYTSQSGQQIQYAVRIQHTHVAARAATVADAIRDINDLVMTRNGRRPVSRHVPAPVVFMPRPATEWLPYKDAEL